MNQKKAKFKTCPVKLFTMFNLPYLTWNSYSTGIYPVKSNSYFTRIIFLTIMLFGFFGVAKNSLAKDLFVSTIGDDAVTYTNNDISHPWLTPEKAWYNAQAGDNVYFRGGTYYMNTPINTRLQGNDGTLENPIVFQNYNDESVTLDFTQVTGNDNSGLEIQKTYNYIDGLNIVGDNFDTADDCLIRLGENSSADGFKITNSTLTCLSSTWNDNTTLIRVHEGTNNITIEDCTLTGPGDTKICGIQMFRTAMATINRNEISNCDNGIMHKHSNACVDDGLYITNNYIHDCGTGIRTISNYGHYENNLIVNCSSNGVKMGDNGGIGDCGVGADNNFFDHNTFYNNSDESLVMVNESNVCENNEFTNNIFGDILNLHPVGGSVIGMTSSSDYNLYKMSDVVYQNYINYTLPTWQTQNSSDANSLSGSPDFVGGASPSTIAGFALSTGSVGENAGSDGKDMGADVSLVGVNVGAESDTTPPSHPIGLSVE